MKHFIGIDIGTYSSKGVLVDKQGTILSSFQIKHDVMMPEKGWAEHDPEGTWWKEIVEITNALLSESGCSPKNIEGLGISTIAPCVVPVDKNGKALRNAILYGIDTRAYNEIEYLKGIIGEDEIIKRSGVDISSQSCTPKILWLKNNEPEIYKKTNYFLTGTGYINFRLTGNPSLDMYTSVGYPPLINIDNKRWDKTYEELITPIKKLPPINWSCQKIGKITQGAAKETGLLEGTPVITGTADAAAEAISAGLRNTGDMMMMFGSSNFFILKTTELMRTKEFWSANFIYPDSYVLTGGLASCGSLIEWYKKQFTSQEKLLKINKNSEYAALSELYEFSSAGANGLVTLPYFAGERTPINNPKAKGIIFGLTLRHTKADIYRSLLESVGFGIRHNLDVLSLHNIIPKRIISVGGGTKNKLWMQTISDICNITQHIPEKQIGASYGDAFMAGVGVGILDPEKSLDEWVKIKEIIYPNEDVFNNYKKQFKIYKDLYETNKNLMKEI